MSDPDHKTIVVESCEKCPWRGRSAVGKVVRQEYPLCRAVLPHRVFWTTAAERTRKFPDWCPL